jgi:hypothetical protein
MKNHQLSKKIFVFTIFMWSCITSAGSYRYSELQMLTFDDMQGLVKKHVQAAEKMGDEDTDGARIELREALQLIFSRPNTDNMVSQLIPTVRTPLRNLEAFESSVIEIADGAIEILKDKKAKAPEKATSHVVLANIMSEMKPDIKNSTAVADMFKKIRDSKLEVTNDVKNELRMRGSMKPPASPSEIARRVIGPAK